MGIKETALKDVSDENKGFIGVITTVFVTLVSKTFDQFEVIRNLRKTTTEKFNLMIAPLRESYKQIMSSLASLQGLPEFTMSMLSTQLKDFFANIIRGYIKSTHLSFNDLVKDITKKAFDGLMQAIGLIFPFNLLTNSLTIGKEVTTTTGELTTVFNTFLTKLIISIKKQIDKLDKSVTDVKDGITNGVTDGIAKDSVTDSDITLKAHAELDKSVTGGFRKKTLSRRRRRHRRFKRSKRQLFRFSRRRFV